MEEKIYTKRREKRLKQNDLAKILLISRNSYGAKERGEIAFTIPEARRLANFYGCTIDDLFDDDEYSNDGETNKDKEILVEITKHLEELINILKSRNRF